MREPTWIERLRALMTLRPDLREPFACMIERLEATTVEDVAIAEKLLDSWGAGQDLEGGSIDRALLPHAASSPAVQAVLALLMALSSEPPAPTGRRRRGSGRRARTGCPRRPILH